MTHSHYIFRSQWSLSAPADEVYAALADVPAYPTWWPQVRSARQLDDATGELVCRSLLPYDLTLVAHREIEDPIGMVLHARLSGDLDGWSRWTVAPAGPGTLAVFAQQVEVRKALVRRAGLLARPALLANHELMMRAGERGLRRHLQPR